MYQKRLVVLERQEVALINAVFPLFEMIKDRVTNEGSTALNDIRHPNCTLTYERLRAAVDLFDHLRIALKGDWEMWSKWRNSPASLDALAEMPVQTVDPHIKQGVESLADARRQIGPLIADPEGLCQMMADLRQEQLQRVCDVIDMLAVARNTIKCPDLILRDACDAGIMLLSKHPFKHSGDYLMRLANIMPAETFEVDVLDDTIDGVIHAIQENVSDPAVEDVIQKLKRAMTRPVASTD